MPDFDPLNLNSPLIKQRASIKPRLAPLASELIARKADIARTLHEKVARCYKRYAELSPEQQRAMFYRITHEGHRLDLTGTGLRIFDRGAGETYVMVRSEGFEKYLKKIEAFESAKVSRGHIKNQGVVLPVHDMYEGVPGDRLSDWFKEHYESLIKEESILFEIELLANDERSIKAQAEEFTELLRKLQTVIGLDGVIYEHEISKGFARVVLRASGAALRKLVEESYWQTRIVRFEQRPQFETFNTTLEDFSLERLGDLVPPDEDAPRICIIDSGVNAENPFLKVAVKEARSFLAESDEFDENGHGSGIASLAAFRELNLSEGGENKALNWIVSARILDADNSIENRLFSRVLREVVEHYSQSGVRIFNLSVCTWGQPWNKEQRRFQKRSSWIARRIDQLCKEYDVVFVISAGNLTRGDVTQFIDDGADFPKYFQSPDSKILDPAQAALAVTVGSIAPGTLTVSGRVTPMVAKFQPSPFTRVGPGVLSEIKPDLVDYGGSYTRTSDKRVTTNAGTNMMMASNEYGRALQHAAGTSYAVPRVSHTLGRILHQLNRLGVKDVSAPLLRAFLINSAQYKRTGGDNDEFSEIGKEMQSIGSLSMLYGYGTADADRALFGDPYTAICYYQGILDADHVAFFRVPVPRVLSNIKGDKFLTITLAFAPEVNPSGLRDYISSRLHWRLFRGDASEDDVIRTMSRAEAVDEEASGDDSGDSGLSVDELLARDENAGMEVTNTKELTKSFYGLTLRSRGTVQHDRFRWVQHKEDYSNNDYLLAVTAQKRWGTKSIPYAIVVRLEESTRSVPIYSEVQTSLLETRVEIEQQV